MKKTIPPFFIIGAQRSGTTLLRLMLNAHSQIAIPEEGTFWMPLLRSFRKQEELDFTKEGVWEYLRKNSQFQLWNVSVEAAAHECKTTPCRSFAEFMSVFYDVYAQKNGKLFWGDKTPSFFRMVPVLQHLFPEAKFIHLIRDGRDNYVSWKRMNVHQRNASVAAFEWSHKIKKAREDLKALRKQQLIELRYEDLVREPEETLVRVCRFLGVEFEAGMLNFWRSSAEFIGAHHSQSIFKPVTTAHIGKWRTALPEAELRRFEYIAGKKLEEHGYELCCKQNVSLFEFVIIVWELGIGLPRRLTSVILTALSLKLSFRFGLATKAAGIGGTLRNSEKKGG